MTRRPSADELRDVVAEAIWLRVTQDPGTTDGRDSWQDLWPVDREEFELDAEAVLERLAAKGYVVVYPAEKLMAALRHVEGVVA